MPSITQMFAAAQDPEAPTNFDIDEFFAETRPEPPTDAEAAGTPLLTRAAEMGAEQADAEIIPITQPEPEPEPIRPAATVDPLSELPPERRARLLALDKLLTADPAISQRILAATQPVAPAEPELPEEFDPDSPEAMIWRDNRNLERRLSEIQQVQQQQILSSEQQRARTEASTAVRAFAERYGEHLAQDEILEISRLAGESGIAGALAASPQYRDNLQGAYEKALETTLWTNELYRGKVVPTAPVIAPADTVEAVMRKAQLHALSSAASPIAAQPAQRPELQTREDGRLTPQSRQQAIQELATGLARAKNQGY